MQLLQLHAIWAACGRHGTTVTIVGCRWGMGHLVLHDTRVPSNCVPVGQLRRHEPVSAEQSGAHLCVLHRLVAGVLDLLHWVRRGAGRCSDAACRGGGAPGPADALAAVFHQ